MRESPGLPRRKFRARTTPRSSFELFGFQLLTFTPSGSKLPTLTRLPSELCCPFPSETLEIEVYCLAAYSLSPLNLIRPQPSWETIPSLRMSKKFLRSLRSRTTVLRRDTVFRRVPPSRASVVTNLG